jgi:hypothetical protein
MGLQAVMAIKVYPQSSYDLARSASVLAGLISSIADEYRDELASYIAGCWAV